MKQDSKVKLCLKMKNHGNRQAAKELKIIEQHLLKAPTLNSVICF